MQPQKLWKSKKLNLYQLHQVVSLDLETTDKIESSKKDLPHIVSFGACSHDFKLFHTYVTPYDPDCVFTMKASSINKVTRQSLYQKPESERPVFHRAWKQFLQWLDEIGYDLTEPIVLCAFNGFNFDFKLILHHLELYKESYELRKIYLVDPFFNGKAGDKQNLSDFQTQFNELFSNSREEYPHTANGDSIRL